MPIKHLCSFWNKLNIPLLNCEINLILTWSKSCVLTDLIKHAAVAAQGNNPERPAIAAPVNAAFTLADTKLYVPVTTLSTENDNKLLEQLKTGFKRTAINKYRSEMSNESRNNNSSYLSKYYTRSVEIKDFNVLIDQKSFFDFPIINKEKAYKEIIEMSRNNDYTTGKLLDYEHFWKHYKLIAIDLSKQIKLENPDLKQQINFIGGLERKEGATMF